MRVSAMIVIGLLAALSAASSTAMAGGEPMLRTTRVATGLTLPIYVCAPPGNTQRLFIIEKTGRIKILNLAAGLLNPTPFLDIDALVGGSATQTFGKGLFGMAFDPDYTTNGSFYLHYYDNSLNPRFSRFSVSRDNPDIADPDSEFLLLTFTDPFVDHNGGSIDFGPDGYLWIPMGDGGTQSDPENDAQNLNNFFGKILRIDVHGGDDFPADPNRNYAIPTDNPFAKSGGAPEILHWGFRNPYRASFDRETGNYYIADVGQVTREELSVVPATASGLNFGWKCTEGTFCPPQIGTPTGPECVCGSPTLYAPAWEYSPTGGRCIIGGHVYRGCDIPELRGQYLFSDNSSNNMWRGAYNGSILTGVTLINAQLQTTLDGFPVSQIVSWGEDGSGEIYMVRHASPALGINGGEIYKVVPALASSLADLNCDGLVNGLDLGTLLANWSIPAGGPGCHGQTPCESDLNGDGVVDGIDLGALLAAWTI